MACRLLVKRQKLAALSFFWHWLFIVLLVVAFSLCRRKLLSLEREFTSKCSQKADARGRLQKIVAFSLYGKISDPSVKLRYVDPLIKNAQNFTSKYPGWVMRIYHNITSADFENWRVLDENFGQASNFRYHVDLCNVNSIKDITSRQLFAMTWRFIPMLDEFVDVFMSRDSDSLISQREIEAVREWINGPQVFHVMRDHPHHCIAMLGGLWGAKLTGERTEIKNIAKKMLKSTNHVHRRGFDQDLLGEFLWPFARNSLMTHDSYCCSRFRDDGNNGTLTRPFPSQRLDHEFVGKVAAGISINDDQWPSIECPEECRPIEYPKWNFC